uniref:Uncharacterized protein n=1 Tax=Saimiri boliviensis boliviensis TaxID=39432 RepID=A0A2K6UTQ3_SAIBB
MAFRGFSLGPGLLVQKASQMLTFFHPWVKMSSISFYSSFVTSLLSGRAAVAEPVIISALFSCLQRQPGPRVPLWETAGS